MTVAIVTGVNSDAITLESCIPSMKFGLASHPFVRTEFDKILGGFGGLGRGENYEDFQKGVVQVYSLAEQMARRVSSRHNKNVIFILFGDLGSGKSMSLLQLALYCAMWLKYLLGGKVSDYFTFENVAVIDPENLRQKLENLKRYGIYVLDDMGPAYDARTFMSQSNRDLNYILQTARTMNNILLVTAPHGAMLDVTIHRVALYYAEVAEARHDQNLSFLKVMRIIRAYREKKIYYTYMGKKNVKFIRYYTDLPPKRLKDRYDIVRDEQAKIIQARRVTREGEESIVRADGRRQVPVEQEVVDRFRQMVLKDPHITKQAIEDTIGVTHATIGKYARAAGYEYAKKVGKDKKPGWKGIELVE